MELYVDPVSTTSRAVLALCRHEGIPMALRMLSLMKGEHQQAPLADLNPNRMVPVLVDGDFVLTEASAILRYLARRHGSPLYPQSLREAARVDEAMGWFDTNFFRDFGYQFVYPQFLPQHRRATDEATRANVDWGRERAGRWLAVLDSHFLRHGGPFLLGDQLTLADLLGASILSLGEIVGCAFAAWPNVCRWRAAMDQLPAWHDTNAAFRDLVRHLQARGPFVPLHEEAAQPA